MKAKICVIAGILAIGLLVVACNVIGKQGDGSLKDVLVSEYFYDENEEVLFYLDYEYDSNGNRIKDSFYQVSFFRDNEISSYFEYDYDSNGNKIKSKTYENEVLLGYVEYAYDSGLVIKSNHYDQNNELIYYSDYFYDDKKNMIKVFAYEDSVDGNPTMTIIYNYKEI